VVEEACIGEWDWQHERWLHATAASHALPSLGAQSPSPVSSNRQKLTKK